VSEVCLHCGQPDEHEAQHRVCRMKAAFPHTAAALMLDDSGGDLRLVSQTLGHSSLGQTVDRYGGIAARAMQKAADAMDRMLADETKVPTRAAGTRSRRNQA